MSHFAIGNLTVYPSKATISYQDLDGESERNADGYLVRQVIRRDVVKIELEFPPMDTTAINEILVALAPDKFTFYYPDPLNGGVQSIEAYCGDRQLGYMRLAAGTTRINMLSVTTDLYDGLRVSIIEY